METTVGYISVVQEGRFRLETGDGRSALFLLDRSAPLEPQDLPVIARDRVRVAVRWTRSDGRLARLAHDIQTAGEREP